MKNKNNYNKTSVESGVFTLELAISYLQNVGICTKGLINVILRTGNNELALQMIAGKYEDPELEKSVIMDNKKCLLLSYNPWDMQVSYVYSRNRTKSIYVLKSEDAVITLDNYKDYEQSWSSSKELKNVTITLPEIEDVFDNCYLSKWQEAEVIVPVEFSRDVNYTID